MNRLTSPAMLWIAVGAAVLLWGWFRIDQATSRTTAAQAQFATLIKDLNRLEDLRGKVQAPVRGRRPQDDLVTLAQKALVAAGLPVTACSGVQPRADQSANGLRIQTVQLRLQGLRPGEFGAWLAAWSTPDQPWRLAEVQMVHASAAGLDNNRYDLTLTLTAPYLEDRP